MVAVHHRPDANRVQQLHRRQQCVVTNLKKYELISVVFGVEANSAIPSRAVAQGLVPDHVAVARKGAAQKIPPGIVQLTFARD
jgi:hypothetical protein